ncbi:capsid protein [Proteiniclasticum sp. QWL-01]|uniref:capsid protein n=1 Tax=Proteiniclasticum sp. QWL-01 TaxID=3036945 RepID=UPI00240FC667|nr:capsid protein [Proteiniclasticum sp. QWL-01]WFF72679.1 capsid protein [Proteiniclasticum sp. QWL-01]
MAFNYAERFESQIEEKYKHGLTSADMATNNKYRFIDAQTIKIPTVTISGYKDHVRTGESTNRGTISNEWTPYSLTHDRDISFYVDIMDVDETNQVVSAAHITKAFMEDQAIPETDAYRYSKLYADFVTHGGTPTTTILTVSNILSIFDDAMEAMDEAGVPESGRKLKCTPAIYTLLKSAEGIQRTLEASGAANVNRVIRKLDDVEITKVPSDRFKTAFDFTEGFAPAVTAKQIHMIIYHNSAIVAPVKVSDVYLWAKGETPQSAYGWLYQNRSYQDLFLIKQKRAGVYICTAV